MPRPGLGHGPEGKVRIASQTVLASLMVMAIIMESYRFTLCLSSAGKTMPGLGYGGWEWEGMGGALGETATLLVWLGKITG